MSVDRTSSTARPLNRLCSVAAGRECSLRADTFRRAALCWPRSQCRPISIGSEFFSTISWSRSSIIYSTPSNWSCRRVAEFASAGRSEPRTVPGTVRTFSFSLRRPLGPAILRSSVAASQVKVGPKAPCRTAVADSLSVPLAAWVSLASASPSGSISDLADRIHIHDLQPLKRNRGTKLAPA